MQEENRDPNCFSAPIDSFSDCRREMELSDVLRSCIVFVYQSPSFDPVHDFSNIMLFDQHHQQLSADIRCTALNCSRNASIKKIISQDMTNGCTDCFIQESSELSLKLLDTLTDGRHNDKNLSSASATIDCWFTETFVIKLDALLAGCAAVAMTKSPTFVKNFLAYVRCRAKRRCQCQFQQCRLFLNFNDSVSLAMSSTVSFPQCAVVRMTLPHKFWINFSWCGRLHSLVVKRMELDDAMNWLSTLGGAYSALGDYFIHHAVNAAQISVKQLRIALEMGSPAVVIRCHLYFALSLMQTRRLREARLLIRQQFLATKWLPVVDVQLLAICRSLWNRLRYLRSQRHQNV